MDSGRKLRVFVVENHLDTLSSLKLYLEDLGHEVKTATTIGEALDLAPPFTPDLLLCDIGLPDGTGWELLQKLPAGASRYAVAMSGFGMNADTTRSHNSGFRRHLLKPFKIMELNEILSEAAAHLIGAETNQ